MNTIIIGGGASGLSCAIKIKQQSPKHNVMIIEHLDTVGKKILATGNGRCNLTNTNANHYNNVNEFFESLGLMMKVDSEGRVYPYSNQATTVLNILINECEKLGIKILTNCTVDTVKKSDDKFIVNTNKGKFVSDYLVLATGGQSQKSLGSDGSGYKLANTLGHTTTMLSPALVQLKSSTKNCKSLKGLRIKSLVKIQIEDKIVDEEYGELLFTDYGISGIVVMNLSNIIGSNFQQIKPKRCTAIVDFVPELSEVQLAKHIEKFGSLKGILPDKLCNILQKQVDNDISKMPLYAKNWKIIITGTKGYDFAQITNGGIDSNELNDNFKSLITDNLYIVGELTDNQFNCGGFNLNFAFYSGITAANSITNQENE